jgi:hypothetical protein
MEQPGTAAAARLDDGTIAPLVDKSLYDLYMPLALSRSPEAVPVLNGVPLPGGIVPFLADDLIFVLDMLPTIDPELAPALDLDRVGVFGMSLGGYVGPEACRKDSRFKACLAVDSGHTAPVAERGLDQPLMIISRDADIMRDERRKAGGWPEAEIEHTVSSQRALFQHNRSDAYYVTMNGMHHVNWTDVPIWSPLIKLLGLSGPEDPYAGFAATSRCSVQFFETYLGSAPAMGICSSRTEMSAITRLECHLLTADGRSSSSLSRSTPPHPRRAAPRGID